MVADNMPLTFSMTKNWRTMHGQDPASIADKEDVSHRWQNVGSFLRRERPDERIGLAGRTPDENPVIVAIDGFTNALIDESRERILGAEFRMPGLATGVFCLVWKFSKQVGARDSAGQVFIIIAGHLAMRETGGKKRATRGSDGRRSPFR